MAGSDRPLTRRLVKLAFSLFGGRARAHWQDGWPGLKLRAQENGARSIFWRGQRAGTLLPFADFALRMPAQVTICGSGPSISDMARDPQFGAEAIVLNGALSLTPEIGAPLAFFVEDERFVWRHFQMIRTLLPRETLCAVSPSALRALLSLDRDWAQERALVLIDNLEKPWRGLRRPLAAAELTPVITRAPQAALSHEPGQGIVACGTVAFSALQFALASEAETIRLAGVDLSNADQPRFYEKPGATAKSGILRAQPRILPHFDLALQRAQALNKRLCCLSPRSALVGRGYPLCALAAPEVRP